MSEPVETARRAVEIASERQASDVVLLDITGVASFADYFVVMSGEGTRQVNALVEAIAQGLKESGARLHRQEGSAESGWVLLDYSDVVIHVFAQAEREYYQLEQAWRRAVPLIRVQ